MATIYVRLSAVGTDNVPRQGPVIIAANHASFLDPILVGVTITRRMHFMARESLFRNWFFGWAIRALGSLPVSRDRLSKES